jgi:osmotically-inducible protein OsmY
MFWNGRMLAAAALFSALAVAPQIYAQEPDNTKVNKRDQDKTEPTADQAKNNMSDRQMMKTIRKAIMDDKSLSTYAHNIKVIAQGGKVTLKGPVHTEEEKRAIEAKAVEVAGTGNVTNDISVKGDSADRKTNH